MSHDIIIKKPFSLNMDVVNFDAILLSIQMSYEFEIDKSTYCFSLKGISWFILDDIKIENEGVMIKSMDNDFLFNSTASNKRAVFSLGISYRTFTGETADFKYDSPLHNDESKFIEESFRSLKMFWMNAGASGGK